VAIGDIYNDGLGTAPILILRKGEIRQSSNSERRKNVSPKYYFNIAVFAANKV
jgi:hypothetical protein